MAHELSPDAVRNPGELIAFLNRLREDIERDEKARAARTVPNRRRPNTAALAMRDE